MFKKSYIVYGLLALLLVFSIALPVEAFQTSPVNGAMDIPIDRSIVIDFDYPVMTGSVVVTVNPDMIYPMEKRWSNDDRTLTLTPMVGFINEQSYTFYISGEYVNGTEITEAFSFTTAAAPGILETISEFFYGMYDGIMGSLYGIIVFLIIIILGLFVSWIVKTAVQKTLVKSRVDEAMRKIGIEKDIQKIGLESFSSLISVLIFWFIFAIFLQIALDYAGIVTLSMIFTPIILFIPRIIVAIIIMIVGLYVADLVAKQLKKVLDKGPIGDKFRDIDEKTKHSGFSLYNFLFIFVKIFILLIFAQVALSVLAISVLSSFITPILLFMPLLLTALAIIFFGLIVADYVVKILKGLLNEMDFNKLVDPVEAVVNRQGLILKVLSWVIQALVILIFVQIAVGVLNSTGAFNTLAILINSVILWIPNLIVAIFIGLLGFWVSSWAHDKVVTWGKDMDIPFNTMIAKIVQFTIIYIALTMALAQAGIEVPMLYLVFTIAVGAVMIGVGVGFAYGSKDIFNNLIGYLQSTQALKVGQSVQIEEHKGIIEEIGRYHVTLKTSEGLVQIPHSKLTKATIIKEAPPPPARAP